MSESLADAVTSGDEYRILVSTRRIVAEQIDATESGRDLAALSKQMQELTSKISQIEKSQRKRKSTPLDMARRAVNGG